MLHNHIIAPDSGEHDVREDLDLQIKIELIRHDKNLNDEEKLEAIAKAVQAKTREDFLRKWLTY